MVNNAKDKRAVRTDLVDLTRSLLVGPLAVDEVIESAPVDTYLTGILWPRGTSADAVDDDEGSTGAGGDDPGADSAVPGYRAIRPCSIGITLAVRVGAGLKIDLGTTARYELQDETTIPVEGNRESPDATKAVALKSDSEQDKAGSAASGTDAQKKPRKVWARRELGYSLSLAADGGSKTYSEKLFDRRDGTKVEDRALSVHVRRRAGPEQYVFTITLINEEDDSPGAASRDAKCLFQTELIVRAQIGDAHAIEPRPLSPPDKSDWEALTNALLYRDVREFAAGHGIAVTWDSGQDNAIGEVRTSWMPGTVVPGTSAAGHSLLSGFRDVWPDALRAAWLGTETARESVNQALDAFVACYGQWIEASLEPRLGQFGEELGSAARANFDRCVSAHTRMRDGVNVLRENPAAWTAFALANAAMDRQSNFPSKGDSRRPLVWRPFQLAFMLLVIPGLVDPGREDRGCMDLLWFPTGGGKTEAYLALTAFQIFHRRLTHKSRRADGGVDVLMRYTLRLLTVQQFQRAAALISACDFIRQSDSRLGDARITLGLYVGGEATPNNMEEARKAIAEEHANQAPLSTPRQLLQCPVCGSNLPATAFIADAVQPKVNIVCVKPDCETAGNPLPVLTVDEEIYAAPPSLLIGTVDKFAQIPRRTDIRSLFSLDGGEPPGLIIQDELHLISGPLGSMAGLYETVIDTLCTRGKVRPKVIGSTATIGHAEQQVRALFDRSVLQFPPPGFDSADSFYAVRDTKGPDRIYVGIPTAGRSPKFALQALVSSLLQAASHLREMPDAELGNIDPYWTCVAYFNSLRELGGAYVLMQDDVPRQMQFLSRRLDMSRRELQNLPVELSSRRSSRELPELLQALSGTLEDFEADPLEKPEPKDTVLASNMISVGVDVPRLGLMVVNGQPKSTAEYIQASSRVGRGIPGLVFTLCNSGRPRDLSHFEHFHAYHRALYKSVEATSVTPWAPRARDKALHAVVASLVRHLVTGMSGDEDAVNFDSSDPMVQQLIADIVRRAAAATDESQAEETKEHLQEIVAEWEKRSAEARTTTTGRMRYWIKKAPFGKTADHLMCAAEEASPGGHQAWPTPNSMREVEPSSAFVLRTIKSKPEGK
ncbi:helicase-related protein [Burkholderia stagnalis]|uniref:helicase-related protein n=1 Tax=Burkholderia stagnalis TaxID=1503054 RepID=UPI000F5C9FDD|nr:helicase-related protein [Burkholderia stagnalis]RQY17971.1 helicase [Burkholderia stagnalis]RQY91718.1 helicase [Burkholderia stagnalis]RQY99549.1 helicase [Burkholderia stagnalis]